MDNNNGEKLIINTLVFIFRVGIVALTVFLMCKVLDISYTKELTVLIIGFSLINALFPLTITIHNDKTS